MEYSLDKDSSLLLMSGDQSGGHIGFNAMKQPDVTLENQDSDSQLKSNAFRENPYEK